MKNNKIIVILGPTASGKSSTAIQLAKKFDGEILSADSRQIYRGMDIGTGKVEAGHSAEIPQEFTDSKFSAGSLKFKPYFSEGIPHYGIDIVSPHTEYNVAKFKKYADKIIADILQRGKVPIIAGGTGFWIKAIVDNITYPEVKPNPALRRLLSNKSTEELFAMLKKLDPTRAASIDVKNPVRLIRAIEICQTLGKVPNISQRSSINSSQYKFLQIGIKWEKEKLNERIKLNVEKRFEDGMIEEVQKLHSEGLSWKRIASFGLSYKIIPVYLKEKNTSEEVLLEQIFLAEKDYAKRQMTWFKKDRRIVWLDGYKDIKKEVRTFLEG